MQESEKNLLSLVNKVPDLILDFSAVNYVDTNGVNQLKLIIDDYKSSNIFVYICGAQDFFLKLLFNMKLLENFNQHLFISIEDALEDIRTKNQINL